MIHRCLLLVAVLVVVCSFDLIQCATGQVNLEYDELCGITSTWTMLHECHVEVSLDQVRSRFEELRRKDPSRERGHTMQEIEDVLESFGLTVSGYYQTSPDLNKITTPAILYIAPDDKDSQTVGHFIVVSKTQGGMARVVDFQNSRPVFSTQIEKLNAAWGGKSLEVAKNRSWQFVQSLLLISTSMLALILFVRLSFSKLRFFDSLFAIVILLLAGCDTDSPPLVTDSWRLDFGEFAIDDGELLNVEKIVDFHVLKKLRIASVSPSCRCVTVAEGIVGETFRNGDAFELPIRLNLDTQRAGRNQFQLGIFTDVGPFVLTCECFVTSRPSVRPEEVYCSVSFPANFEESTVELNATWHRPEDRLRLDLDWENSDLGVFRAKVLDSSCTRITRGLPYFFDRIVLELVPRNDVKNQIGSHDLRFQFKDGSTSNVKVHVSKESLIELPFRTILAGNIATEKVTEFALPLQFNATPVDVTIETNLDQPVHFMVDEMSRTVSVPYRGPKIGGDFSIPVSITATHESGASEARTLALKGFAGESN